MSYTDPDVALAQTNAELKTLRNRAFWMRRLFAPLASIAKVENEIRELVRLQFEQSYRLVREAAASYYEDPNYANRVATENAAAHSCLVASVTEDPLVTASKQRAVIHPDVPF